MIKEMPYSQIINHITDNLMFCVTLLGFTVFSLTLSEWAAGFTILAAVSTIMLNYHRYRKLNKK